ncbi:MAG: PA0069 family radical SAM protein [Pseudomonadota bacterium]
MPLRDPKYDPNNDKRRNIAALKERLAERQRIGEVGVRRTEILAPMIHKGRGAVSRRAGRFETERIDHDEETHEAAFADPDIPPGLETTVTVETPRRALSFHNSPDLPFDRSVNPYRGCEHGCVYCYARPSHSYMGLSPGLDFESRLFAKKDIAGCLAKEINAPNYQVAPIALGSNTDPYQPIERQWRLTRSILETLSAANHPCSIVTKSTLVRRDIDILAPMAKKGLVCVFISLATLDDCLARHMDPRAPAPAQRAKVVAELAQAGIPTGVMVAPIIPGLTDPEIESILRAVAHAGAMTAYYTLLRLPYELKDLWREWLDVHYPDRARKVMSHIHQIRGGRDNDPRFGKRFSGEGVLADVIRQRFYKARKRYGLMRALPALRRDLFCRTMGQIGLFDAP